MAATMRIMYGMLKERKELPHIVVRAVSVVCILREILVKLIAV